MGGILIFGQAKQIDIISTWDYQYLDLIPKLLFMNGNELTPDNNSEVKLKASKIVDSFFSKRTNSFRKRLKNE